MGVTLAAAPFLLSGAQTGVLPGNAATMAPRTLKDQPGPALARSSGAWSASAIGALRATGTLLPNPTAPEPGAVAWVVGTSQPLALGLDLWAFSQSLPATSPAARAVAVPGGWLLPRPGLPLNGGAGGTDPDAALRAAGSNTNTAAKGIALTGILTVTLTGLPSAAWAAAAGSGSALPGAQTLTFVASTGVARIPAGVLTPASYTRRWRRSPA